MDVRFPIQEKYEAIISVLPLDGGTNRDFVRWSKREDGYDCKSDSSTPNSSASIPSLSSRSTISLPNIRDYSSVTVNVSLEHDSSSRPDSAAAIYRASHSEAAVPDDAPPLFILCADDDDMASPISVELYSKWRSARRPVELHIYSQGGHGFGMERQGFTADDWISRFDEWLNSVVLAAPKEEPD